MSNEKKSCRVVSNMGIQEKHHNTIALKNDFSQFFKAKWKR